MQGANAAKFFVDIYLLSMIVWYISWHWPVKPLLNKQTSHHKECYFQSYDQVFFSCRIWGTLWYVKNRTLICFQLLFQIHLRSVLQCPPPCFLFTSGPSSSRRWSGRARTGTRACRPCGSACGPWASCSGWTWRGRSRTRTASPRCGCAGAASAWRCPGRRRCSAGTGELKKIGYFWALLGQTQC